METVNHWSGASDHGATTYTLTVTSPVGCFSNYQFTPFIENDPDGMVTIPASSGVADPAAGVFQVTVSFLENQAVEAATISMGIDVHDAASPSTLVKRYEK